MTIECAYCGWVAPSINVLKTHIKHCDKHPYAKLQQENDELKKEIADLKNQATKVFKRHIITLTRIQELSDPKIKSLINEELQNEHP